MSASDDNCTAACSEINSNLFLPLFFLAYLIVSMMFTFLHTALSSLLFYCLLYYFYEHQYVKFIIIMLFFSYCSIYIFFDNQGRVDEQRRAAVNTTLAKLIRLFCRLYYVILPNPPIVASYGF